jgi:hypothetical protein
MISGLKCIPNVVPMGVQVDLCYGGHKPAPLRLVQEIYPGRIMIHTELLPTCFRPPRPEEPPPPAKPWWRQLSEWIGGLLQAFRRPVRQDDAEESTVS